jgi:hypothetical protein
MPDLNIEVKKIARLLFSFSDPINDQQISSSTGGAKLSKWLVIEGQKIEDGIQMCEV